MGGEAGVRANVVLVAGGVVLEAGCACIWVESARLTAIYNAEYTREFFARLPWLERLSDAAPPPATAGEMAALVVGGLLVMSIGYLVALVPAQGRGGEAMIVGFAVLFRATLALLPGLFSSDVFSYVMYGRVAALHAQDPYVVPPSAFADDAFLAWVFPFWRDATTVYGPLWTDISLALSRATANWSPFLQVSTYRATLVLSEALTLVFVWWALGRARRSLWMVYAWNPLVLFDLVGATHNDALMLMLTVLGAGLIARSRWLVGSVALSLGALVKFASAIVVLVAAVGWAAQATTPRERWRRLALGLGLPLVLAIVAWLPWADGLASIANAGVGRLVTNSAPFLVAQDTGVMVARAAFVGYLAWELVRVWRGANLIDASVRLLLALPLLVLTWVWSWYFSWALSLAVLAGSRTLRRVVVAYTLVALPIVYAHQYLNEALPQGWILVMALAPLSLSAVRESSDRRRSRSPSQPATDSLADT